MCSTISEVRQALLRIAAAIDPAVLPQDEAVRLVEEASCIQRVAATITTLVGARVAEGAEWRRHGARSPEEWFARATGRARDGLDTAQRLRDLPGTEAAARNGELSPEQLSEIASAASQDPTAEQELLDTAKRRSLRDLRDTGERVRNGGADAEERRRRAHRRRSLRTWTDRDGAAHLAVATTPELLAELRARLAPYERAAFDRARAEGRREPPEAYAHDGFFALVGSTGDGAAAKPPAKVVVVIDHAALVRGWVEGGETCEIAGVGVVPVSVAREALGDAFLAAVVGHGVDIRTVAHLGRTASAAQRTALELRDPCCAVPGCDTRHGLEIDHTTSPTGWADTRRTTLDELARLCHTHHQHKTHDGWTLTGPPGNRAWHPPPDRHHTRTTGPTGREPPDPAPPSGSPVGAEAGTQGSLLTDDHAA